jgi:hemolysin activation/secretion protein
MADKNLDSSEKFSLGGPNAVRAYPVNEALGDEGYLLNVELRYDAYQNIEVIGFIDHGGTVLHATPWTGSNIGAPNQYTLSGGGIGVNWKVPGNFMIKGVMAERIGNNPGQSANGYDSDGSHKAPRFWVSLSKYF